MSDIPVRWLTQKEVAMLYNVSESWVRDHANGRRQPYLPGIKLGKVWRFREDALRQWEAGLANFAMKHAA